MKKKILASLFYLSVIFFICFFNALNSFSAASPYSVPGIATAKEQSRYSSIFKKLNLYKNNLIFLSSGISKKERAIKDLRNKIKASEAKIEKLKKKIKKDDLLIKNLIVKVFIINKEYDSDKLLSFKNDADAFIINYQLKNLLEKKEKKLSKLVNRKNKFLNLKKYMKKEKNSLMLEAEGILAAKKNLQALVLRISKYIKSLKMKHGLNKKNNKTNRLLKHKVIKLIKNLKDGQRKNYIQFTIIK
jgi:septal ring factor EnvC (AmiA/AmiB activator)